MRMLSVDTVHAGYGAIAVLHGVSLYVDEGEIVTLLGANGAGKSTLLRAVSHLIPVTSGSILYKNENITAAAPHRIARMGIAHVPEGRAVFGNLTVEENLLLATYANTYRRARVRLDGVLEMFPVLEHRRTQPASTLSGGEQQMLAIARALITDADLFIMDEPSLGLSPIFINHVYSLIIDINRRGKTIFLVEQNAAMALKYSSRAYVLENGTITAQGTSAEIAANEELRKAYLG